MIPVNTEGKHENFHQYTTVRIKVLYRRVNQPISLRYLTQQINPTDTQKNQVYSI
jgi:hypothetical protein